MSRPKTERGARSGSPRRESSRSDLLPGTLDLLILRTLRRGSLHGYGIAQDIRQRSVDVLRVGEGSLYPALQRLRERGLVEASWQASETGRRARYYWLTPAGELQLDASSEEFDQLVGAIRRVMAAERGGAR